jgi:hypothetical protein
MRFFRRLQFAFEKISYISPMRVLLQLPISVAPTPTRQFRDDQAHHKRLRPECDLQLLCSAALISGLLLLRRVLLSFGDHKQR